MNREEILARINELEALLESMPETDFQPGDTVNYTDESGRQGVAEVEMVSDSEITVRVLAVAGDTYEPTDDVLVLKPDQVSAMGSDESDEEDSGHEPDEPAGEEDIEEDQYVKWSCPDGEVVGKIELIDDAVTLPDTGDEIKSDGRVALIEVYHNAEGYERTGVFVGIPVKNLTPIEPPELKPSRLMVKMKDAAMGSDESMDWFEGLGSAYGKVDLGGDTVAKGAYTQTISHNEGKVQLMFNHGWKVEDVAGVAYLEDRDEGLWVKGKMPTHIPSVKDGYDKLKFMLDEGKPLGLSIGYFPVKSEPGANGTRVLKEIALEEISITPWPMDTHARIRDAKNRKIGYNAKRKTWQTALSGAVKAGTVSDAPAGNQDRQDDYESLVDLTAQLKSEIEEYYVRD